MKKHLFISLSEKNPVGYFQQLLLLPMLVFGMVYQSHAQSPGGVSGAGSLTGTFTNGQTGQNVASVTPDPSSAFRDVPVNSGNANTLVGTCLAVQYHNVCCLPSDWHSSTEFEII